MGGDRRTGQRGVYAQVYNHYADLIDSGQLQPGDRMPTLHKVQSVWDISHVTAAKVMRLLRDDGYVRTSTQGTFVFLAKQDRLLKQLRDTLNALEEAGQDLQLEVGRNGSCILGRDGGVCWDNETETWVQVTA